MAVFGLLFGGGEEGERGPALRAGAVRGESGSLTARDPRRGAAAEPGLRRQTCRLRPGVCLRLLGEERGGVKPALRRSHGSRNNVKGNPFLSDVSLPRCTSKWAKLFVLHSRTATEIFVCKL